MIFIFNYFIGQSVKKAKKIDYYHSFAWKSDF